MCSEKTSDNCIKHLTEPALMMVYNDIVSIFEKLLEKDNSVTIHVRNLIMLAIELYKLKENLAVPVIHKIFEERNTLDNIWSQNNF